MIYDRGRRKSSRQLLYQVGLALKQTSPTTRFFKVIVWHYCHQMALIEIN